MGAAQVKEGPPWPSSPSASTLHPPKEAVSKSETKPVFEIFWSSNKAKEKARGK